MARSPHTPALISFAVLVCCAALACKASAPGEANERAAARDFEDILRKQSEARAGRPTTPDGYEVVLADPDAPADPDRKPSLPELAAAQITRNPTSPDPEAGEFTLEEATRDLAGEGKLVAELRTDLGTMYCDLHTEKAPRTVANFVGLARGLRPWWDAASAAWVTRPLYDGTSFHRVIPGFMIQGGDSLGDGSGGVGYEFPDEVHPSLKHDAPGRLCMANHGVNTNGGQFFITDGAAPHLDEMNSFTIFGQCEPVDVVARIARVPQAGAPTNRPLTRVSIDSVRIVRSPQGAAGLRAAPAATSPASVPPAGTGPVHRNASPPPRSTLRVNP